MSSFTPFSNHLSLSKMGTFGFSQERPLSFKCRRTTGSYSDEVFLLCISGVDVWSFICTSTPHCTAHQTLCSLYFKLANNPQDYLQDDSFPGLNTRYTRLAEPATWKKRETSSQTRKKPSRLQHKH